ncbi:MAG: hypothetical protein KatS3mg013_0844 [Actinomycetota bacterium]|jgi:phage shock protein C|nr:MAG: hypothetical protein KatS3mg013_0844 [Actinomycetota bacterium]
MSADETTPQRLLRRSREDRVLLGVAGGLGRYLGVDPVAVRLAFVILTLTGGSGILLYLVAALVIPEERPGEPVGESVPSGLSRDAVRVVGLALVVLGALGLLWATVPLAVPEIVPRLVPLAFRAGPFLAPVALAALGVVLVIVGSRR